MVKLFFADALDHSEAQTLLASMLRCSEARLAALYSIASEAERLEQEGNAHSLHTLAMGTAFHQAIL